MPPCLVWDLSEPVAPDFVLHLVVAIHKKRGCHDSRVLTCLHSIACQRRSRDIKLERALSLVPSFSPPRLSLSRAQVSLLGIDGIGGPNRKRRKEKKHQDIMQRCIQGCLATMHLQGLGSFIY
ncbi:hypothetical protein VPH35_008039 [Triticum aestivum]